MPTKPWEPTTEIQVGRFETFLRRLLSIKRSSIMPEVDSRLQPGIDLLLGLYDDQLLPAGWRQYRYALSPGAGGVGNFNRWSLLNPTGSNMLAVVLAARMANLGGAAATYSTYMGNAAFTAGSAQANVGVDSRMLRSGTFALTGAPSAMNLEWLATAAAIPGANFLFIEQTVILPNTTAPVLIRPVILTPGFSVGFGSNAANNDDRFVLGWIERPLEKSELSLI